MPRPRTAVSGKSPVSALSQCLNISTFRRSQVCCNSLLQPGAGHERELGGGRLGGGGVRGRWRGGGWPGPRQVPGGELDCAVPGVWGRCSCSPTLRCCLLLLLQVTLTLPATLLLCSPLMILTPTLTNKISQGFLPPWDPEELQLCPGGQLVPSQQHH